MDPAYDAALTNRQYDKDNRLHILRSRISKACVSPYYGREIPNSETLGLDPNKIYYLLRDPSELKKAAPSFARVPLMFKHIAVSADDPQQEQIAGTIGSDVEFDSPYLTADLSVWDVQAIAGIETDTVRELSCSYHYTADMTPGVFEGKPYDGVMRNILGNHVALVPSGRAGSDVLAADSSLENNMKETKFGKAIYAILCAISPKLAEDAALKPLVITAEPKTFDPKALTTKLLAMDGEMQEPPTLAAMQASKAGFDEMDMSDDSDMMNKMGKDCDYCHAKDGAMHATGCKTAMDMKKAAMDKMSKDKEMNEQAMMNKTADMPKKDKDMGMPMKNDAVTPQQAMDAFEKKLRAELKEIDEAKRAVRSVVGDVLAQDSAAEIYGFALDQMKVDHKGVEGIPALRALFNLANTATKTPAQRIAFDSVVDMTERFPNAARQISTL